MYIRPLQVDDHPSAIELLVQTFGPFFNDYARPLLGEQIYLHQHGHWEQDYRDEVPTLHDPSAGRHASVATAPDGALGGLVSWRFDQRPRHGEIYLLAVSPRFRRQGIGHTLCEHAIGHMRAGDVEVVQIGTGGDPFHAPARALYEQLGFTKVPVSVYLGAV